MLIRLTLVKRLRWHIVLGVAILSLYFGPMLAPGLFGQFNACAAILPQPAAESIERRAPDTYATEGSQIMPTIEPLIYGLDDAELSPVLMRMIRDLIDGRHETECDGLCDILETEINKPLPPAPRRRR